MNLTKEEAIRMHRELWDWLSKNPEKEKEDWPEWEMNDGEGDEVLNDCFCCEYADGLNAIKDNYMCENCPLIWPNNRCQEIIGYNTVIGLFEEWRVAANDDRARLAAQIRDLPVREGVE